MGGCASTDSEAEIELLTKDDIKDFALLLLSVEDLKSFSLEFHRLSLTHEIDISILEISMTLDLPSTLFISKLLTLLSYPKSKLSFKEFTFNMWYFLIEPHEQLIRSIFYSYCKEGYEYMTQLEVHSLVFDIQGGMFALDSNTVFILDSMDLTMNNKVTCDEFLYTMQKYPKLVIPLYNIQDKIRGQIIGHHFWDKKCRNAVRILDDVRVQTLLDSLRSERISRDKVKVPLQTKYTPDRPKNRRRTPVYEVERGNEPDTELDSTVKRKLRIKGQSRGRLSHPDAIAGAVGIASPNPRRDVKRSASIIDGIANRYPSAYIKPVKPNVAYAPNASAANAAKRRGTF